MAAVETIGHIRCDGDGVAWVDDTNVKVVEVVLSKQAYELTPEELHDRYPHLSLAQIYAALAYYYDHQPELDTEIARRAALAQSLRERTEDKTLQERLREAKKTWKP